MKSTLTTLSAAVAALIFAPMTFSGPAHAGVSCYGGVTAGYSVANTEASLDAIGGGPAGIVSIDGLAAEGGSGGLLAGCDYRIQRFVIGAWGDYSWHNADFEVGSSLIGASILEASLERQWSAGGRLGAFVSDSTLVYGLVGFTRAEFGDITSPALGASLAVPEMDGIVYGGGIEVDIGSGLILGAEYRYTDLDAESIGLIPGALALNLDPDIHSARAVLKYRFDFSPQTY